MQRLSGLDASFLYLETAAQPLHVCSIMELDTSTMPGGSSSGRYGTPSSASFMKAVHIGMAVTPPCSRTPSGRS